MSAVPPLGGSPTYSVIAIEKDGAAAADGHLHVVGVTTRGDDGERRWTLVQATSAIRDGGRFILGGGAEATAVEPAVCPRCPLATLVVDTDRPEAARTY
jgi:hypothetical protein